MITLKRMIEKMKTKLDGIEEGSTKNPVYTATSKVANTWTKIATVSFPYGSTWLEKHALFAIKGTHTSTYKYAGLASISANIGNSSNLSNKYFKFVSKTQELDLNNFYIESKNATKEGEKTIVNVWARGISSWGAYKITPLINSGFEFMTGEGTVTELPSTGFTGNVAT